MDSYFYQPGSLPISTHPAFPDSDLLWNMSHTCFSNRITFSYLFSRTSFSYLSNLYLIMFSCFYIILHWKCFFPIPIFLMVWRCSNLIKYLSFLMFVIFSCVPSEALRTHMRQSRYSRFLLNYNLFKVFFKHLWYFSQGDTH